MFTQSSRRPLVLFNLLAILVLMISGTASAQLTLRSSGTRATSRVSDDDLHSSPVMFIENAGQWDRRARFQVWGGSAGTMWLAEDAIWITVVERTPVADSRADRLRRLDPTTFDLEPSDLPPARGVNIKLSFVGANPHPRIEPFDRLDTVVSYFVGSESEQWRPAVPVWGGVRYVDLYPGVNLEITSEGGQMVQRLVARPDADLSAVRLRVEGADDVAVVRDVLRLSTAAGTAALPLLRVETTSHVSVQMSEAQVFDVEAPFASPKSIPQSAMPESAGHAVADLQSPGDNPTDLLYGTFLGGSGWDYGYSIAVDGSSNAYVTGDTPYADFPTTPGSFDRGFNGGNSDAFVVKLNPSGSALVYAAFLGGSSDDYGIGITVDGSGAAYVTGATASADFPTTPGAFDRSYSSGGFDAFVVKVDPAGAALACATFLGGSSDDEGHGIAVDGNGTAYVTGWTSSTDFPTTPGAFDRSYNGGGDYYGDAFVVKLNPSGSALVYATFLGGSSADAGHGIALDGSEGAYIAGWTSSTDFPTTPGAFDRSYNGDTDAFVAKLALGVEPTYTISGRVTDASGHGIPGAIVWAGATRSTTTDANGNYAFTGLSAGTYNISPSRYLYAFSPPSRTVTVPPNATGQDFVQTPVVDLSVNRIEVAQVFVEQNDPISGTLIPSGPTLTRKTASRRQMRTTTPAGT